LARGEGNLGASAFRQIGETVASVRTEFSLMPEWQGIRG
jgi:hypothetical protein